MFSLPPVSLGVMSPPFRKVGPLYCYVEYPKGTLRSGKGWSNASPTDYGYINGFLGADHDEVDCYIGPHPDSPIVFVVDQSKLSDTTRFDEHKVMLGYGDRNSALADYMAGHNQSNRIFIAIRELSWNEFMWWLNYGNHFIPIKEDYIPIPCPITL